MTLAFDPDIIATRLIDLGLLARTLSPSWDGAKHKQHVFSQEGQFGGWILPGKGLYLPHLDLKRLGITRPLPHVYEYTPFMRLKDKLRSERGAITTYDGIISARGGGKANDLALQKASITTVASFWYDLFTQAGSGGAGVFDSATPPTDQSLNNTTTGALSMGITNPGGTDRKYLLTFGFAWAATQIMACIIDRHTQGGSFRLSVTTTETVASPDTIVRNYSDGTLGTGCEIIAPVTTARATPGAGTWSLTYLDQAGASSTTPANALAATTDPVARLVAVNPGANVFQPFVTLASGDFGVRQVSASARVAAADTTGVAALSIVSPLVWMPALNNANIYIERDMPGDLTGIVELANSSQVIGCLGMLLLPNATTSAYLGFVRTCSG